MEDPRRRRRSDQNVDPQSMAIEHAIPLDSTADPILLSMRHQEEGIAALHDALLERTEKRVSKNKFTNDLSWFIGLFVPTSKCSCCFADDIFYCKCFIRFPLVFPWFCLASRFPFEGNNGEKRCSSSLSCAPAVFCGFAKFHLQWFGLGTPTKRGWCLSLVPKKRYPSIPVKRSDSLLCLLPISQERSCLSVGQHPTCRFCHSAAEGIAVGVAFSRHQRGVRVSPWRFRMETETLPGS